MLGFFMLFLLLAAFIFVVVAGGIFGPAFNRFNPFLSRDTADTDPACGRCGYLTRGISSLHCPECGADLREVGIMTAAARRKQGMGCLMPLGFTGVVLVLASTLASVLDPHVPYQEVSTLGTNFRPNSGEYVEVRFEVTAVTTHTGSSGASTGWSSSYSHGSGHFPQNSLSWGVLQPPAQMQSIQIEVDPVTTRTAWRSGSMDIDPQTQSFSWIDLQGRTHTGGAPLTQQDVLAFLKTCGADTSQAGVQNESRELFAIVDGLGQGMYHFSLNEFSVWGSSSSSSISQPMRSGWVLGYCVLWIIIWIGGLVWLNRRSRRKQAAN